MYELKDPKLLKWIKWTEQIHQEVTNLLIKTHFYDEYVRIVEKNPEIQNPRDFHDWVMRNYFDSALMCIRRLTDTSCDCISLMSLLREIKETPNLITLDFYLRNCPEGHEGEDGIPDAQAWTHAAAVDLFNAKFSLDGNAFSANIVEQDIQDLTGQTKIVEGFIDNTVAHRNVGGKGKQALATKHVRDAIQKIEQLAIKYIDLMGCGSYGELTPVFQYDPAKIFLKPWINTGR